MFNDDVEFARSRLTNTYMAPKNGGPLHLIRDIIADGPLLSRATLCCRDVSSGLSVDLNISFFKFSPGSPGYVNSLNQGAVYLSRIPLRRDWRQGLRSNQFNRLRNNGPLGVSREWFSENIRKISESIQGVFLDFEKAIELAEEIDSEIAFSRNFAIDKEFNLLYKSNQVGQLTREDTLKLDPRFNFLEEELIKEIGNENFTR